mmetsp:Transcript_16848/g.43581  ORF Transcript_16848/g.43581 Transcript_16848/m.43581 type:complete len:259 (+) Transcript_16848:174-950(+)
MPPKNGSSSRIRTCKKMLLSGLVQCTQSSRSGSGVVPNIGTCRKHPGNPETLLMAGICSQLLSHLTCCTTHWRGRFHKNTKQKQQKQHQQQDQHQQQASASHTLSETPPSFVPLVGLEPDPREVVEKAYEASTATARLHESSLLDLPSESRSLTAPGPLQDPSELVEELVRGGPERRCHSEAATQESGIRSVGPVEGVLIGDAGEIYGLESRQLDQHLVFPKHRRVRIHLPRIATDRELVAHDARRPHVDLRVVPDNL